jgi:outer membrane immunogenic protein
MQRFVIVGAGLLAMAGVTAAHAADLPARAPYTPPPPVVAPIYGWGGFYLGINGGGGSARECYTITSVAGVAVPANSEGCHNATGGLAGGQVGYRWQMASWAFGVEAQGDWANLKGTNSSLTAIIPYTNRTKVDAIGLFTGQVGYAFSNVLLYVKGGAAVTDNKYDSFFTGTGVIFNSASETRWGGTVGAGIEFGFAPNLSVALEYDHLFMGSNSVVFPASAIAVTRTDTIKQNVDIGTVRINYTFGGPVVARY